MTSVFQRQKGREGLRLTLGVFIQTLNLAKDTCGVPPAEAAFGCAGVLLTMILVRSLPLYEYELLDRVSAGYHGKKSGLPRACTGLR